MRSERTQPRDESLTKCVPWFSNRFRLLASGTRPRVLISLSRRGKAFNELALTLGVEHRQPSKHLAILRHEAWITGMRFGKRIVYSLGHGVHIEAAGDRVVIRHVHRSGRTLTLTVESPLRPALRLARFD